MTAESVIGKNEEMSGQQKWRPENRGSDRKMVVDVARRRVLHRKKIPSLVRSSAAEARVGPEPVLLEIEIVLDEQRPAEGVVSDPVAADPRIDERERQDEKKSENFVVAREPSQLGSSSNESQFVQGWNLRAIALRSGFCVERKHMILTIPFSKYRNPACRAALLS